ncbi:MAG: iron-sulfur cluster-binding protein [Fimbriimonadaceae bacterium]|nr:iron-sulfur cluster-binding protein [Fimbriimonadaceae bacterium]
MKRSPVESFARNLKQATTDSVRSATSKQVANRLAALASGFADSEAARTEAASIKDFVLNNLFELRKQLAEKCEANGIQVHFASDKDEANRIILDLCRRTAPNGATVVKGKSMATEEIHLNEHLEAAGFSPIETDLGEYVVQIDHDKPSHIVAPIIHKNRREIATSFEREKLGDYTEVPEELAMQARAKLREKFQEAEIGISGVNFAIAETGRIVLLENEGNNRLSTTAPRVHIALMGIEKMLPSEADLPLFIKLLASSATGQQVTSYVHLISGPRRSDEPDGPREVHLVILDNGRSKLLDGPYRDILRCIRCGACLNVCPVYRQASGHAYGHVYSGPLGAILAPALEGVDKMGYLAKASTLCGACEEVCPVKIPIPQMLLRLRDEGTRCGAIKDPVQWSLYAAGATNSRRWRTGLSLLPMASGLVPHPMKSGWGEFHVLPKREGESFRNWWSAHRADSSKTAIAHQDQPEATVDQPPASSPDLWTVFGEKLSALGGEIRLIETLELAEYVVYLDEDVPAIPEFEHLNRTGDVWQADVGITMAEFAVAETGSLVLSAGPGRARLASLAPPIHVVLVRDIVPTFEDAFARIDGRTSVIVSGTSRTADIEGVLVRGVHGPKSVIVVRI